MEVHILLRGYLYIKKKYVANKSRVRLWHIKVLHIKLLITWLLAPLIDLQPCFLNFTTEELYDLGICYYFAQTIFGMEMIYVSNKHTMISLWRYYIPQ